MTINDVEGMSNSDLLHYAREQRKFIFNHYEKYKRHSPETSLTFYIQKVYVPLGLANKFHEEYMANHLRCRDYTATVTPK
jgi:hypothetical protein